MERTISKAVTLLHEANCNPCTTNVRQKVWECMKFISVSDRWTELCSESEENLVRFTTELNTLLCCALIPEFIDRELTVYNRSDFKDYDALARSMLELSLKVVSLFQTRVDKSDDDPSSLAHVSKLANDAKLHSKSKSKGRAKLQNILKILPNLFVLIGGNIRKPLWSSKECQDISVQLLKDLVNLLDCNNVHDVLVNDLLLFDEFQVLEKTVLDFLLHLMEKPLSTNRWERNPFLCECFSWFIQEVHSPNLTNHVDQIMAVSLNFIHSHESISKVNGFFTLKHLIENVSGEELRWYNRAEVIYEVLRNQMYSKEEDILDIVLKCLFVILKVLEKNLSENSEKHHVIMTTLLRDAELENLLVIRQILIKSLAGFILDCHMFCIQHLSKILHVVEVFLNVGYLTDETAHLQALQTLENVIVVAWPRIHHHSKNIIQFLLRMIVIVTSPDYFEGKNLNVIEELISKASKCVQLLLKVNPTLHSFLKIKIKQSKSFSLLEDFCDRISLEECDYVV